MSVLAALHLPGRLLVVVGVVTLGWVWQRWRLALDIVTHATWLVTAVGVVGLTMLRAASVHESPVAALAREARGGRGAARDHERPGRPEGWFRRLRRPPGSRRERRRPLGPPPGPGSGAAGRRPSLARRTSWLDDPRQRPLAACAHQGPDGGAEPTRSSGRARPTGPVLDGAEALRDAIRGAVAHHGAGPRTLVPALVDGDDAGMPEDLVDAFRTAGLTHLLAVSGTNLTLVVGSLLLLARWWGVRARGLMVVGILGVAGFVLLARTEPSVLRAAVMGSVALVGMGTNGRARGSRALGAAVLILLLLDPWLAESPGFALSALATAGILWLAPGWRDRLQRWLPRWMAEAVSVPLAAQLACTPLVAGLSAQVSLVAVAANLAAAPLVGPATVLGLAGGVTGLVSDPLGRLVATPAAWCASGIIAVAEHAAALPVPTVGWPTGPAGIALLTVVCVGLALVAEPCCRGPPCRRARSRDGAGGAGADALARMAAPRMGVGGVRRRAGRRPRAPRRFAQRLGRRHRSGPDPDGRLPATSRGARDPLAGAHPLPRRSRRRAERSRAPPAPGAHRRQPAGRPADGVRRVEAVAASARRRGPAGVVRRDGGAGAAAVAGARPVRATLPSSDSPPNDASVVLLVETRGVRILLMGDQEETSQAQLRRDTAGDLRADVLKVAHHGSARQDTDLVRDLGARLAVVSLGADNDYGHPAPVDPRPPARRSDARGAHRSRR